VAFAELEDLEMFLGVDLAGTDPVRVDALLSMASAVIKAYVGHNIVETTETVTVNGSGTRYLFLPGAPVTAVSAVTVDGEAVENTADLWYWDWNTNGVLTHISGWWPYDNRNVSVTYTYGYPTVPDDVKYVCVQVAARGYQNPLGLRSETIGSYSYSTAIPASGTPQGMTLTRDEMSILDGYRVVLVG
jgi:hypothetical protein